MSSKRDIKNIIFDFDGVILDALEIKTRAFRDIFRAYPSEKLEQLVLYHLENGGMPRYDKIRYFFEVILAQTITEEELLSYAEAYSCSTKEELYDSKYLIVDALQFIQENHERVAMHIASGADEMDLKSICSAQGLNKYFLSINGSPMRKEYIVEDILKNNGYSTDETILIGDSINDLKAAKRNHLRFFGYNNRDLLGLEEYIETFKTWDGLL